MTLRTDVSKPKKYSIFLSSIFSLTLLWGTTATADPVDEFADQVTGQPDFFL